MAKTKIDGTKPKVESVSRQARSSPEDTYTASQPQYQAGHKVRVWWPPTREKKKTDYAGMYWPVKVLEIVREGLRVRYDNGEEEIVDLENVHPYKTPVDFGEEQIPFQVGEFVEVFNDSDTDPASWLARIDAENKDTYTVSYPFHDTPCEEIKPELLRRARIFEKETQQWKIIKPHQEWNDGEVESPLELETICGKELAKILSKPAAVKPMVTKVIAKTATSSSKPAVRKTPKKEDKTLSTSSSNKRKGAKPERARV